MSDGEALWVYAVTRPDAAPPVTGVAGGPVRLADAVGLAAVVSPVDLAEFGEEPLRRNLEKLPWLEAVARAHHQVVAETARTSQVVPMRLATVYRTKTALVRMLVQRAADFEAVLARTVHCSEWGVKAYLSAARAAEPAVAAVGSGPGSGADYLKRRRAQLAADEDARHSVAASAQGLHAALCAVAEAAALHRPQDPQLSGIRAHMIMNATYLVADRRREQFTATVSRTAERDPSVRVEITGPWPPYSFATMEAGP
ncbi:MAG TPA: GvpL/GvpF family gas vesicle protein [Streptosporangiaceae bacterium]|nr:GvpL/GvpF family gas vesicle protein [Streptosporangiaceae bacterium]